MSAMAIGDSPGALGVGPTTGFQARTTGPPTTPPMFSPAPFSYSRTLEDGP